MNWAGFLFVTAAAMGSANAATIDLNLTGVAEGPASSVSGPNETIKGIAYAEVSAASPVTVVNGDTVNLTLSLDAPVWLVYPYGLAPSSRPYDELTISFTGAITGTTTTTGITSLYVSNQMVASQPILANHYGSGSIVDSIQLGGAATRFDAVTSTFVVNGLTSPATLQWVHLDYTALPPSQSWVAPVVFDGGVQLLPAVPEPASSFMMVAGLALLLCRRARPSRQ